MWQRHKSDRTLHLTPYHGFWRCSFGQSLHPAGVERKMARLFLSGEILRFPWRLTYFLDQLLMGTR